MPNKPLDSSAALGETAAETVFETVARLGTPPADITQEWIEEAAKLTGDESLTSFDPDDEIWKTLRVGNHGQLSMERPGTPKTLREHSPSAPAETTPDPAKSDSGKSRVRSRWVLAGLSGLAVAGVGWLIVQPDGSDEIASRSKPPKSNVPPAQPSPRPRDLSSLPTTAPIDAPIDTDFAPVETVEPSDGELELVIEDIDALTASTPADFGVGLSLDAFIPPTEINSESEDMESEDMKPKEAAPTTPDRDSVPPTRSIDGVIGEAMPMDLLSENLPDNDLLSDDTDDADLMAESDEQATTRRDPIEPKVTGVAIPAPPRRSDLALPEPILLLADARDPQSIELQMPTNSSTGFQLKRDAGNVWRIVDEPNADPIARILTNDANELQFEWLDAARQLAAAATLTAGRLRTSDGDVVYLRPRLDTEPIKLTLAKRDLKLKWNLQASVPSNVTEIHVSQNMPPDVDWKWLEELDTSSPRSTRGVGMINLNTSDDVAVVVRMDVKTTNSLSLRLRFGARLDPKMPWQWTDAKSIRESFEAVTKQLESADAQLLNLEALISRAKRMRARRQEFLLEEQRDRIDEAVSGWTVLAKRLADLDQLVAFLDADASLSPELVVQWDDGQQIILGTLEDEANN